MVGSKDRKDRLIGRLARTNNLLLKGAITYLLPFKFYNSFYSTVTGTGSCSDLAVISFDCDHEADIGALPSLLEVLDSSEIKCSFACVGKQIERHPREHRMILDHGHEIVNHTQNHPFSEELKSTIRFDSLGTEAMKNEIAECHRVCKNSLDYEPVGFRIPHFGIQYTSSIYGILGDLGYSYSSSLLATRSNSRGSPFRVNRIVEFPVTTCPVHPFQAFDTYHAFRSRLTSHKDEADFLRVFARIVDFSDERHLFLNVCFDPQDTSRFKNLNNLLEPVKKSRKLVTYRELVKHFTGDAA